MYAAILAVNAFPYGRGQKLTPPVDVKKCTFIRFYEFFFQVSSTNFGILSSPLPRTRRDLTNLKFGPKLDVFFESKNFLGVAGSVAFRVTVCLIVKSTAKGF